jgi:hypothetical protein
MGIHSGVAEEVSTHTITKRRTYGGKVRLAAHVFHIIHKYIGTGNDSVCWSYLQHISMYTHHLLTVIGNLSPASSHRSTAQHSTAHDSTAHPSPAQHSTLQHNKVHHTTAHHTTPYNSTTQYNLAQRSTR